MIKWLRSQIGLLYAGVPGQAESCRSAACWPRQLCLLWLCPFCCFSYIQRMWNIGGIKKFPTPFFFALVKTVLVVGSLSLLSFISSTFVGTGNVLLSQPEGGGDLSVYSPQWRSKPGAALIANGYWVAFFFPSTKHCSKLYERILTDFSIFR